VDHEFLISDFLGIWKRARANLIPKTNNGAKWVKSKEESMDYLKNDGSEIRRFLSQNRGNRDPNDSFGDKAGLGSIVSRQRRT
jgi:hypothetical protein